MANKVVIIGGVAGGASTAARLRRNDEQVEIVMFEKGEYISFANCGLPYYIGETIQDRSALLVQTPEAMKARFNIDVRVKSEVLSINKEAKTVQVIDHSTGHKYDETYDVLVLSPGSVPLKPPIPGIDSPNIFSLWNIPDTDAIKGYVDNLKPRRAAVIGGGFIGLEMAENLYDRGAHVTLIEMMDQVMAPIDYEMATQVHSHMRQKGVQLLLKDGVKSFEYNHGVTTITLQSGKKVEVDMVILSIGIRPQSELAKAAGLAVNERGGIVVDEYLKTSDPNIYAIGDAIEVNDFMGGFKTMIPLAAPANKQGRMCANNICDDKEAYVGTQGTSIAKVFDLTVASTGLNEKTLKRLGKEIGKDYQISIIHAKSHAGYYPGAIPMALKLIFHPETGKVLGSQIVGYDGVDKRIDVIATALRFGATVKNLMDLELAYAPPYSSAKDPVNMVAFSAENIMKGKVGIAHYYEAAEFDKEKTILVDVREQIERDMGFIQGSINIPVDSLRDRLGELDPKKDIILYCAIGLRGYVAARILKQHGFENVRNLSGGYTTYSHVYCGAENEDPNDKNCCNAPSEDFEDSGDVVDKSLKPTGNVVKVNACGLQCPGPIMQVHQALELMEDGDVLEITATDPGFATDIKTWCKKVGHTLMASGKADKSFYATIMKGTAEKKMQQTIQSIPNNKTMVVFSDDMDKAIASLIIANGAASMGRKVTMFYTFWGLNIIKKHNKVNAPKDFMGKMFGMMLPRGTKKLKLSQMNMMGMGPKMIRHIMKTKNVDSLETLLEMALKNGVNMIACNMSMDLMGVHESELIDGVTLGGVATYLGEAEDADVNLFI